MSEVITDRIITVDIVHAALNLVTYEHPEHVEPQEPVCDWRKLCGDHGCKFPRYSRGGKPVGLTAHLLIQLGYPLDLLKALDFEFEIGELLHPGVKIGQSRNLALLRLDSKAMALLVFLQNHSKLGRSWSELAVDAFRPRRMIKRLDARRRPWLY